MVADYLAAGDDREARVRTLTRTQLVSRIGQPDDIANIEFSSGKGPAAI